MIVILALFIFVGAVALGYRAGTRGTCEQLEDVLCEVRATADDLRAWVRAQKAVDHWRRASGRGPTDQLALQLSRAERDLRNDLEMLDERLDTPDELRIQEEA